MREPKRLPRALDQTEIAALLSSFRRERDRAIAGLMLFSGQRSQELLSLHDPWLNSKKATPLAEREVIREKRDRAPADLSGIPHARP